MGRVWTARVHKAADTRLPNTGIVEDYFAPGRPADDPNILPLANVRCFASLDGPGSEALAHRTWEQAPSGWYHMTGSAGRYTLLFTGPSVFVRPVVFTNIYTRPGDRIDRKVTPNCDYGVFHDRDYDDDPAACYYQTFVARATSVTNVGFKVVHDGVDGAGPQGQTILVSIHRKGPGTPDTWDQLGPAVPVPNVDSGGAKNYEWSAAWNSGEVLLTPGQTYAVALKPESPDGKFQMFWRPDDNKDARCYRIGPKGEAGFVDRDLWMYVAGDGDGLVIPYNKHIQMEYGEFAGFARKWSQTYVARGRSLAGVVLYTATGGSQPGIHRQRAVVRVRQARPDGPIVGVEKIAVGNGIHTGDASWGTFGLAFAPGEVPLVPGRTYAVEFESIENYASLHGYVNIKGVVSDEKPGFNPYRQCSGETYEGGTAYRDGKQDVGFDLDMQIIEYEHDAINWDDAVHPENLLENGDAQTGTLAPDNPRNGRADAWEPFSTDAGTAHCYVTDGANQDNRILRVMGDKVDRSTVDGGFVQRVEGLSHVDTYRVWGLVRSSWPVDVEHACYVGIDPTGQDENPSADTIRWTPLPGVHSIFVPYTSEPVRPETSAISVWLRGWTKSASGHPFKADFDNFELRRVDTGVPALRAAAIRRPPDRAN